MANKNQPKTRSELEKLVSDARLVCTVAHSAVGQLRKYTDKPYHTHPFDVANVLSKMVLFSNEDIPAEECYVMTAAALLHDVVEDTHITLEYLIDTFGLEVGTLVRELTKHKPAENLSRFQRTVDELERLASVSYRAKQIKVCDIYCNINDLYGPEATHDEFAITYLAEQLAKILVIENTLPENVCRLSSGDTEDSRFIKLLFATKAMIFDRISVVNKAQPSIDSDSPTDRLIMVKVSRLMTKYRKYDEPHLTIDSLMSAYFTSISAGMLKSIGDINV